MDVEALLKSELSSYEATSWTGGIGGTEITLYAKPLTSKDISSVRRNFPDFMTSPSPAGMIHLIMSKASDADENRVFTPKHRPLLERLKTTLIGEIFTTLFADQLDEDDDEQFGDRVEK